MFLYGGRIVEGAPVVIDGLVFARMPDFEGQRQLRIAGAGLPSLLGLTATEMDQGIGELVHMGPQTLLTNSWEVSLIPGGVGTVQGAVELPGVSVQGAVQLGLVDLGTDPLQQGTTVSLQGVEQYSFRLYWQRLVLFQSEVNPVLGRWLADWFYVAHPRGFRVVVEASASVYPLGGNLPPDERDRGSGASTIADIAMFLYDWWRKRP